MTVSLAPVPTPITAPLASLISRSTDELSPSKKLISLSLITAELCINSFLSL